MRLVLAAVFAVAGLAKLRDRDGTRTALAAFGAPAAAVPALSILLPLAELAVAGCLLVDPAVRPGAAGALLLLAVFSLAIAVSLAGGRTPDCHCFGQVHSAPIGSAPGGRCSPCSCRRPAGPAPPSCPTSPTGSASTRRG